MKNNIHSTQKTINSGRASCWAALPVLITLLLSQQTLAKEYYLYGDKREGTKFKEVIYRSKISLKKNYAKLSEEQKQLVRAGYSNLSAEDTPPFPKKGLKKLLKPYVEKFVWYGGQAAAGTLYALVDINGTVTEVKTEEGMNSEVIRYMTKIFKATKFDPGLCAGTPCEMYFRLRLDPTAEAPERINQQANASEPPRPNIQLKDSSPDHYMNRQGQAFIAPKQIEVSGNLLSSYPSSESSMARTGRVLLSLMVDKQGNVFEPVVERVNNPAFSASALKWISKVKYEPATLNGVPVDSWRRFTAGYDIGFVSTSKFVSTKLFNTNHDKFNKEIVKEDPDQKKLQKYLKRLVSARHGSHYAYELISKARYHYSVKFGNKDDQINAIKEMMLSNDKGLALVGTEVADKQLIRLLVASNYYGEALDVYYDARYKYSGEMWESFEAAFGPSIKEIEKLATSDQAFGRAVKLDDVGSITLPLLKRSFTFDQVQGGIDTLKLRCMSKFKQLKFVADVDYKIPESWGDCQLQIIGTKNSKARMIQL